MQSNKTNLHFPLQLRALKRASKDVSAEKKANRVRGNERASALRVLDLLPAMKPFFSAENKQYVVLRRNASRRNDRRWPYAYSQRKDRERESAGSLVCSERGVRLRSLLFLSHTPPPLIFSEGIPPSPAVWQSSLSSCVTSSGIRPRRGEILQLAAWQLSLAPPTPVFFSSAFWFSHLSDIYSSVYRSFEFIIWQADRSDMWAMQTNRGKQRK